MDSEIPRRRWLQVLSVGGLTITLAGCNDTEVSLPDTPNTTDSGDTTDNSTMPDEHGPMRTGRFTVEIGDVAVNGWRFVSIPNSASKETEYREEEETDQKLIGQNTYADIEMEREMIDSSLRDWRQAVVTGKVDEMRKTVRVTLIDENAPVNIEWEFTDAWVKEYDPPDLDATSDGGVATERVVVRFDSMTRREKEAES